MELSLQEQELVNRLRRLVSHERIEIMKDDKGHLGVDYVVFRASRERITETGKSVPMQVKSVMTRTEGE